MHAKKLLSLVLLAVLTVSVLTGCSLEDWLEQFLGDSSSSSSSSSSVSSSSQPGSGDDGDDQPTVRYYNVTVNITGADGGTVSYGGKPIQTGEAISVTEGEPFQFTAAPHTGYSCTVTVNGAPMTPDETNTYTLDNVTSDQTVSVAFARNPYNVTVTIGGDPNGGKVAYNGQIIDSTQYTGTVYYGDDFSLNVTINPGYSCTVTLDEEPIQLDNNNTYTLNDVSNNHDIGITLTRITHTVTVKVNTSSGGTVEVGADNETVTGSETFTVNDGDNFQFTATPKTGFSCEVKVDGTKVEPGSDGSYTISSVNTDHTVEITFTQITYTVTVNISNSSGGTVKVGADNETVTGSETFTVNDGESFQFTAEPADGYTCSVLASNGTVSPDNNTYTVSNITNDCTVTVTFTAITHKITLEYVDDYGFVTTSYSGQTTKIYSGGSIQVKENDDFTFTVTISQNQEGCEIDNVTAGSQTLTANTQGVYTLKVTADTTITIKFKSTPEYIETKFSEYFLLDDNKPKGEYEAGQYYFNGTTDDLQTLIRAIKRDPNFTLSRNNQFIIGNGYGDEFYVYAAILYNGDGYVYYHNKGPTIYEWFIVNNANYPPLLTTTVS